MEEYIKEIITDENKRKKMQIKKIRYGEMMEKMKAKIAYSLDEEAYKRYYPLALAEGLKPIDWDTKTEKRDYRFITLSLDIKEDEEEEDDDDEEEEEEEDNETAGENIPTNIRGFGLFKGIEKMIKREKVKNDSDLTMEFKCTKCKEVYEYKTGTMKLNTEAYKGELENEPVCPKCKSEKTWELTYYGSSIASEIMDELIDELQEDKGLKKGNREIKTGEIIGYSGIERYDDCYGYDENECFVGDTKARVLEIFEEVSSVKEVRIEDLRKDFGCSSGRYAFEPEAYKRFKKAAEKEGLKYTLNEEDKYRKPLYIVELEYEDDDDEED
jgi:rubredoxin